jgi:hypothetical protein
MWLNYPKPADRAGKSGVKMNSQTPIQVSIDLNENQLATLITLVLAALGNEVPIQEMDRNRFDYLEVRNLLISSFQKAVA